MANNPATRRDFLFVCTGTFAAVGGSVAAWPLIAQGSPNRATSSPFGLSHAT